MPSTCVPQYLPRANTGLSKNGDPVFPHFWSWNQNLARVCTRGGGGRTAIQVCRTTFHVCCYGSPHQGGSYQSLTGAHTP